MASLPSRALPPLVSVLPAARQVFRSEHFTVLVDDRLGIAVTVRSEAPFSHLAQLDDIFDELGDVLDELGRSRYALLADMRAIAGRNDAEFDEAIKRQLPRWLGGFRKVGVLVRSVAGIMQIQRHAKQDGIERMATTDEGELLKHLAQEG
ncbi:hypothetical protein [Melittangium boletus]|uniref:Uncharacterized protein n=1 Tax=Melittangium boletus DSM 14713 TaxID=1294270 RepID=A0A250IJJ8_9BACT|nr:hypothetical protein [Melittangium boletus]ATB31116.1 hypothetical protein MEBOL_004578 [Melittangium boletus DSM 14713]